MSRGRNARKCFRGAKTQKDSALKTLVLSKSTLSRVILKMCLSENVRSVSADANVNFGLGDNQCIVGHSVLGCCQCN